MTDTYDDLIRARAANMALQVLINEYRAALLALVQQPFSPKCIAEAKAVCGKQIDTSLGEQHYEEFMELWRQVHGDEDDDDALQQRYDAKTSER